ncbi:MAG: hypothetical protein IJU40_08740 [Desulfovibrionaceae bacterium]|nr:hypothetical protein [Desulfovibrionaceae bacterium]
MLKKLKVVLATLQDWRPQISLTLWVIVSLSVALVGLGAFWFSRGVEERAQILDTLAARLDEATAGTPLAGSGAYIRSKPIQPQEVLHPATNPGTLAGPEIRGESGLDGMLMPDGSFRAEGEQVLKPVTEDNRLSRSFVEDLARFMASQYVVGEPKGHLDFQLQSINQHCGTRLNTEPGGGRQALLKYAFQPTMLKALYHFYVQFYLECLERACASLSSLEREDFFKSLSQELEALSLTLSQIIALEDFSPELSAFESSVEEYESMSAQLTLAQYDLAQLSSEADPKESALKKAQNRALELEERLERCQVKREECLHFFLDNLKGNHTPKVNDDTLLFMAMWVHRRIEDQNNWRECCEVCVALLEDLAKRLREQLEKPRKEFLPLETQEEPEPEVLVVAPPKEEVKDPKSQENLGTEYRATLVDESSVLKETKEEPLPSPTLASSPKKEAPEVVKPEEPDGHYIEDGLPKPIQIPIK